MHCVERRSRRSRGGRRLRTRRRCGRRGRRERRGQGLRRLRLFQRALLNRPVRAGASNVRVSPNWCPEARITRAKPIAPNNGARGVDRLMMASAAATTRHARPRAMRIVISVSRRVRDSHKYQRCYVTSTPVPRPRPLRGPRGRPRAASRYGALQSSNAATPLQCRRGARDARAIHDTARAHWQRASAGSITVPGPSSSSMCQAISRGVAMRPASAGSTSTAV
jgi:hypothetical protein